MGGNDTPPNWTEEATAEAAEDGDGTEALAEALARWINRTPEENLAMRDRVLRTVRKGRPLPEGKTLADVVEGTWPGDETAEEIFAALEKLS